jgi:hypothetical protein
MSIAAPPPGLVEHLTRPISSTASVVDAEYDDPILLAQWPPPSLARNALPCGSIMHCRFPHTTPICSSNAWRLRRCVGIGSIFGCLAANHSALLRRARSAASLRGDHLAALRQWRCGLLIWPMVKNYFQLTSTEQKQYIENLLVDFAKYLQQQRKDDLQVVQTQLNSIQKNTDIFKQETEQILTSIISTVGSQETLGTRN